MCCDVNFVWRPVPNNPPMGCWCGINACWREMTSIVCQIGVLPPDYWLQIFNDYLNTSDWCRGGVWHLRFCAGLSVYKYTLFYVLLFFTPICEFFVASLLPLLPISWLTPAVTKQASRPPPRHGTPLVLFLARGVAAFYRGGTFPLKCFLNDRLPWPKIVGMSILFRKKLFGILGSWDFSSGCDLIFAYFRARNEAP